MISAYLGRLHKIVPDFTTIWQRVIRTKINLDPKINKKKKDMVIAVDSASIKVTNPGE
jgi:hypothetical protein